MLRLKRSLLPISSIIGSIQYSHNHGKRPQLEEYNFKDMKTVYESNFPNEPKLLDTIVHQHLLQLVYHHSRRLSDGAYIGHNGVQSNLLQGPKGIGKSMVLLSWQKMGRKVFKDVIPIYISYDEMEAASSIFENNSLMQMVQFVLEKHGIELKPEDLDKNDVNPILGKQIALALEREKKFVLLLVDEIDQLYRVSRKDKRLSKKCQTTLGDLAWLGNQKTGRFAVYLCGSSASCPLLITADGDREMFPLLEGAPNLNGQKYQTVRLPVTLCKNIEVTKSILMEFGYPSSTEISRLVSFLVGCSPRAVNQLMEKCTKDQNDIYALTRPFNHESGIEDEKWKLAYDLLDEIVQLLASKNAQLQQKLLRDDGTGLLDFTKVETYPWEKELESLTVDEVKMCWQRILTKSSKPSGPVGLKLLQRNLFYLCDKGYITFDKIHNGLSIL